MWDRENFTWSVIIILEGAFQNQTSYNKKNLFYQEFIGFIPLNKKVFIRFLH